MLMTVNFALNCEKMIIKLMGEKTIRFVFTGSCSKADCTLQGDWGEWEGYVEEGTCTEQKRTREYTKTVVYEQHIKECPGLPQECPAAHEETRAMCKQQKVLMISRTS